MPLNARKVAASVLEAAAGIAIPELAAEFIARTAGLYGGAKLLAKALLKVAVGLAAYMRGFEVAGASCIGSISLDAAQAAYPGGVHGIAEQMSLAARAAVIKAFSKP